MGTCRLEDFTKKITIELPGGISSELSLPLYKSQDDAILEFMINNGVSDSCLNDIRSYVSKTIGPDVHSITLRQFLKINAAGAALKISSFLASIGEDLELGEQDIYGFNENIIQNLSLLQGAQLYPSIIFLLFL